MWELQEAVFEMIELKEYVNQIVAGKKISFDQAVDIAHNAEPLQLYEAADRLRREIHGDRFDLCSIINARSGNCSENCRFCAQSSRYQTDVDLYDIVSRDEVIRQGKENQEHGVGRYSLVTAGRDVSETDLDTFEKMYQQLSRETELFFCASMGFLTKAKAEKLYASGVRRYHCNLETSRSYFPQICTTHTWDQKVETITIARDAGMDICSGGIIGLGESLEQRIELAFELAALEVLSIPINILTPIPGTPLENQPSLSLSEVLTCIALFRLINPEAVVRLAGGRAQFGEEQYRVFLAGANGAIVGNYLTTAGNNITEDLKMIRSIGYKEAGREEKK